MTLRSKRIIGRMLFSTAFTAMILLLGAPAMARKKAPDPAYIREFPNTFTVRTFLGEKISGFSLTDGAHNQQLNYRPNNVLAIGVGVTIRGVGLNFSTRLPTHDTKDDQYGKTRQLDLQVHRYKGKFALDIYFQRYRGYHLRDNSDVTAVVGPTDFPYFPDMQNSTFGASGLYVFNGRRFSLRAPIDQQDWQLRSSGSWLLGGSVFSHIISNKDLSIIPPFMKNPDFMNGTPVQEITNYSATLNGGYGYNFILKRHWFIALAADGGAGAGYSEVKDPAGTSHKVGLQLNANARFSFGYNSAKWFSGFYIIYRADRYPLSYTDGSVGSSEGIARFIVARRFATHHKKLR